MNRRDQFGNYLLLKKLGEDALGEFFRAGKIGRQALDRIVFLRIYNGQGLNTAKLSQTLQERAGWHQALQNPNLAHGVDLGQVRGIPYVAYDYVSGKTLSQLLEQAAKRQYPIPLDHALLIAERLALALAVAYETRVEEERILHGFTVPSLILISHEGEVRMSGFEAAPGLRASVSHPLIKEALGSYLAPEVLAGEPAHKSDDVYSLGAVLLELLTGQRTPAFGVSQISTVIDQAVVAADGGNLHPELAGLLKRSLAPRDQRIPDVVNWHKALAKLMFDGQYNPTTFNLAFFMHNLFREEIDRETQEIESEKSTPVPTAVESEPAGVSAVSSTGGVREDTQVLRDRYGIDAQKKSAPVGLIAAVVGGVAVLGGGLYFLTSGRSSEPLELAPPAPTVAPVAAGPSPEEIQAQIEKMFQDRMKMQESQFQQQMQALQRQLEEARRSQEMRAAAPVAAPQPAPAAAGPVIQPQSVAAMGSEPRSVIPEPLPAPSTAALRPTGAADDVARPSPAPVAPSPSAPATPTPSPAPQTPTPSPAATPVPAAPAAAPSPAARTEEKEIVVAPRQIQKFQSPYPALASRMKKEGVVTVKVLIDENGRPSQPEVVGPKLGFGLDEAAIENVLKSTYAPGTRNGVPVKMWFELRVSFKLSK